MLLGLLWAWLCGAALAQDVLFEGLPATYLEAGRDLKVVHAPAPLLPADLREPHVLAQVRGRTIRVYDQGLNERVAIWLSWQGVEGDAHLLAQALLRRQVVHALSHVLDHGLSRSQPWHSLSDWEAGSPGETDTLSYANRYGMRNPGEDLATAAELLVTQLALPGDPPLSPACRLRSKFRLIAGAFELELPPCQSPALDPHDIAGLEFLYIQASTQDPSSIGGHLMLGVLYRPDQSGHQRRDAYTLAAVTAGTDSSSALYVVRGLTGGFASVVQREPYRMTVLRYARENRGVKRIPMVLDAQQLVLALERLDELLQAWDRPYLFLTRNCTQLPKQILQAAIGQDLGLPEIHGPDSILGVAQRLGVVAEQVEQDAQDRSPQDTALYAQALRGAAQTRILAAAPELSVHFEQTQSRSPHQRGQGYLALAQAAQGPARQDLLLYLLWSEQIERYDALEFGALQLSSPAIDALWQALGGAGALDDGQSAVLAAQALEQHAQPVELPPSSHSSLRRVSVMAGVSGAVPSLQLQTQLYAYRLGEARRYALASGLDVAMLPLSVRVQGGADPGVQLRAGLLNYQYITQDRRGLNPGYSLRILPLELRALGPSRVELVELAGALELLQAQGHRHHLGVSAGLAPGLYRVRGPLQPGLGAPLRLFGRLGSGRSALTGLSFAASLTPVLAAQPLWVLSAQAQGQVRLGEVAGTDLALALSASEARWQGQQPFQERTLMLGLWMERY